jgi:hypothetical protein
LSRESIDLPARVLAIRDKALARDESDRDRYRRENPDLFRWKQDLFETFPGCRDTYFVDLVTGKRWGVEKIGVPAAVLPKPLSRRKK